MTQLIDPPAGADADFASLVEDRADRGYFRVNRRSLTDDHVYARQMETIFSHCWLYVGPGSEVPKIDDYLSRTVAGRPLIFWRGADGAVRANLRGRARQQAPIPGRPGGAGRNGL